MMMERRVPYDIRVEYQRSSEPGSSGFLNVTWGWEGVAQHPIPSTALLPASRRVNGGLQPLVVHPTVACAATSQAYGQGLTIATAGVAAMFTITARDEYANDRDDPTGIFLASSLTRSLQCCSLWL